MTLIQNFSNFEKGLWFGSLAAVLAGSIIAGNNNPLTVTSSLVGVTALIFVAKGHALGQILTVIFSILYAIISYSYQYYGEMITYLGMTAPIAVMSVIAWIRNPYDKAKLEVKVDTLSVRKKWFLAGVTLLVTFGFYYILAAFHTSNLLFSTISIATSFLASALMYFRSSGYALAYAANDIVLVILWILAAMVNVEYVSMVVCFLIFLCNDLYGFYNWRKMKEKQEVFNVSRERI